MDFPSGSAAMQKMQQAWVQFLNWEDSLEVGMAIHSSILAWRIPRTEAPIEATVHRVTKSQTPRSDLRCAYLSKALFSHQKNERMELDN